MKTTFKHILIRGDIGVGKSTLIRKLLEHTSCPISGVITKKIQLPDITNAIYLHNAKIPEIARTYTDSNLVAKMIGSKELGKPISVERHKETFDILGVNYIKQAKAGDIIVLDELGFLESEALDFQKAVLNCLDSDIPVIAAVKIKTNPFLEKICSHPNTIIYDINKQNRDELYKQLIPIIEYLNL